ATDTNVDDVANALAGIPFPGASPDAVGEIGHLVENSVDLRDNVLAINNDRCSFWCAQSHVQNSAVFRDVDLVAPKHSVDPPAQSRFLGELHKKLQSLVGDAILGVIQVQTYRLDGHALAAFGIICKKFPQMQVTNLLMVSDQSIPCGT